MLQIHAKAVPVRDKRTKQQVGWAVHMRDFSFVAIEEHNGKIETYVEWGDDQPGDKATHDDWESAERQLDTLIRASM
jgi:hypothetical protein